MNTPDKFDTIAKEIFKNWTPTILDTTLEGECKLINLISEALRKVHAETANKCAELAAKRHTTSGFEIAAAIRRLVERSEK